MQRLSVHQFFMVLTAVILGTTFFPIIQDLARGAGRAGWLAVLPGMLIGLPVFLLLLNLAQHYPGRTLLEITRLVTGKWLSKGIGLVLSAISIYFSSLLLMQIAESWERTVQPLGTAYLHIGMSLVLIVILCWIGIEVFARFTEVVLPLVVLSLIITLAMSLPRFEWDQLHPLMERGWMSIVRSSIQVVPYSLEGALFLTGLMAFIPREKKERRRLRNSTILALASVGVVNTGVVYTGIMVFGPVEAERLNYGLLVLASEVEFAHTITGVESLFMIIWLGANIIKVASFFFISIWSLQNVFGLKNSFRWYLALGIIYLVIALNGPQHAMMSQEIAFVDNYVLTPFALGWIVLIWGIDFLKRKWAK